MAAADSAPAPRRRIIALFDVDGTLTPSRKVRRPLPTLAPLASRPRRRLPLTPAPPFSECAAPQAATPEMLAFLKRLRGTIYTGMVGGSDLVKQREQLGEGGAWVGSRARTARGLRPAPAVSAELT
jgi:hypothetical protein